MKTAFQLVGIGFLLIHFRYPILFFDYVLDFRAVGIYLLYLSLIMSVLSALDYIRFFVEAAARQAKELEEQGITRAALKEQARLRREKIRSLKKRRLGVLRRRRPRP